MAEPSPDNAPSPSDPIRNVCVVAHINAGKTTLVERMLFDSGKQRHCGDVDAGTTTMDWLPEEQSRGISIGAGVSRIAWRAHRVHLVDTPGHVDFGAEVTRALRVADGAVVVIDGVRGVESQTRAVWRALDAVGLPRVVFVNKLDRPTADFAAAVATLERAFPDLVFLPMVVPLAGNEGLAGLGEVLGGARQAWGEFDGERADREWAAWRDGCVERLADLDPTIFAAVVEGDGPSPRDLAIAVRAATRAGRAVPVLGGSALDNRGVDALLDAVCRSLPPPAAGDGRGELRGLVFQASREESGRFESLVRLFGGEIAPGDEFEIVARDVLRLRVDALAEPHGPSRRPIERAGAGEIVAVGAAAPMPVGATLRSPGSDLRLEAPPLDTPVLECRLEPEVSAETDALERLARELATIDPSLVVERDPVSDALTVAGMGELHLEIFAERSRAIAPGVVRVGRPMTREYVSIGAAASGVAECRRRLGDVELAASAEVFAEPWPGGGRPRVRWAVPDFAGTDAQVRAAVGQLERAAHSGIVDALGAADVVLEVRRATLGTGADAEFALLDEAIELAARRALLAGEPLRLTPWGELHAEVPTATGSIVLADLRARDAEVEAVRSGFEVVEIDARVDLGRIVGWATRLRSITQGQGRFDVVPGALRPAALDHPLPLDRGRGAPDEEVS